jgi:NAD(P)H-hydrate repair Nnr-like enzyme with NAD(P)H-hydrate dehydratase domain
MTAPTALTRPALEEFPLPPVIDGGKESKGRILIIAGSREVPGAALVCATAAMRAGAGKLKIATGTSIAIPTGIAMPEAMVVELAEHRSGQLAGFAVGQVREQAGGMDAIVAGPGLANCKSCAAIAETLLRDRGGPRPRTPPCSTP